MRNAYAKESGFTLLETLVAMVITAVVLLATAQMLMVSIQYNKKSELKFDSSATVQSMLQEASTMLQNVMVDTYTAVQNDALCTGLEAVWAARPSVSSYLTLDYAEKVSCTTLSSDQRYMIYAETRDKVTGVVIGSGRTIMTTVKPVN